MFGTLRFVLALIVLYSHVDFFHSFNLGVSAVIIFFILSGFVMTILIRKNYSQLGKKTFYFYVDRFLRIYPQFIFFLAASQICTLLFNFREYYLRGEPSVFLFSLQALIFPINYYLVYEPLNQYCLIPAAWSLGLEEQFYWIFPLLVLIPRLNFGIAIASIIVFALAISGILPSGFYAFRFLPGVIFIFLLGKGLADYALEKRVKALYLPLALYALTIVIAGYALHTDSIYLDRNKEVLFGIFLGFPLVAFLSGRPRQKWDDLLGNASYGIFLSNLLIKFLLKHFQILTENRHIFAAQVALISIMVSFATYYLLERPLNKTRKSLREKATGSV